LRILTQLDTPETLTFGQWTFPDASRRLMIGYPA